jgi:hypothetical protein
VFLRTPQRRAGARRGRRPFLVGTRVLGHGDDRA